MEREALMWTPGDGGHGLRFGALAVSFQRFRRPLDGGVTAIPRSLGALPVAVSRIGGFILPLADDEAFWIGLSTETDAQYRVSISATGCGGGTFDIAAVQLLVETLVHVAGIPGPRGYFSVLARVGEPAAQGIAELRLAARCGRDAVGKVRTAAIRLVDYATFAEDSSRSPPATLDPGAAYKGILLP